MDAVEPQLAATDQVEYATGRSHRDARRDFSALDLAIHARAAVNRHVATLRNCRCGRSRRYLTQFTGGRQHQRLTCPAPGRLLDEGMPKAAVLPVPVWAWPMTSAPVRKGGMDRACTSVGVV